VSVELRAPWFVLRPPRWAAISVLGGDLAVEHPPIGEFTAGAGVLMPMRTRPTSDTLEGP